MHIITFMCTIFLAASTRKRAAMEIRPYLAALRAEPHISSEIRPDLRITRLTAFLASFFLARAICPAGPDQGGI